MSLEPPKKLLMFVDNITPGRDWGVTLRRDKIDRNLELISTNEYRLELTYKSLINDCGGISVNSLGPFILIVTTNNEGDVDMMKFLDHRNPVVIDLTIPSANSSSEYDKSLREWVFKRISWLRENWREDLEPVELSLSEF